MKIKLVFFDMEGTIFRKVSNGSFGNTSPSAWTLVTRELGEDAYREQEATKRRWTRGGYPNYVDWMIDALAIYRKYGLTQEKFEQLVGSIEYYPGVFETFSELRKKGYRTALISGGFKAQADRAQRDLFIDHAFSACEIFFGNKGEIEHFNLLPCDYEGKARFMKLLMKEYGISKRECAFVGDGVNDVFLAREAGIPISFNGSPEMKKACKHSIEQPDGKEDFRAVLEFL